MELKMLLAQSRIARPHRKSLSRLLNGWIALHRERAALAKLDAAALQDIGISRQTAQDEARRPFWDAPDHWSR
jgi:uncharacterized protein YjiS (DUF1127 family)